jgi:hypothetical protein
MFVIQDEQDNFWFGKGEGKGVIAHDGWSPGHALIYLDEPIFVPEGGIVRQVWFVDEHPKMNADFVSEWDDGVILTTRCLWDPETNTVLEQETVDLQGVVALERQYVVYEGEEIEITDEDEDEDEGYDEDEDEDSLFFDINPDS